MSRHYIFVSWTPGRMGMFNPPDFSQDIHEALCGHSYETDIAQKLSSESYRDDNQSKHWHLPYCLKLTFETATELLAAETIVRRLFQRHPNSLGLKGRITYSNPGEMPLEDQYKIGMPRPMAQKPERRSFWAQLFGGRA